MFKTLTPRVEVVALRQKVYIQSKTISHMEKTCKELRLMVYFSTKKGKPPGKEIVKGGVGFRFTSQDNHMNDGDFYPEKVVQMGDSEVRREGGGVEENGPWEIY